MILAKLPNWLCIRWRCREHLQANYCLCFIWLQRWRLAAHVDDAEESLTLCRRLGADAQSAVDPDHRRDLVVLHTHHHFVLHGEPRRLPHRGADGLARGLGRRHRQTDQDRLRSGQRRRHHDFLQGTTKSMLLVRGVLSLKYVILLNNTSLIHH